MLSMAIHTLVGLSEVEVVMRIDAVESGLNLTRFGVFECELKIEFLTRFHNIVQTMAGQTRVFIRWQLCAFFVATRAREILVFERCGHGWVQADTNGNQYARTQKRRKGLFHDEASPLGK